jgi:hypothetical protein
MNSAWLRKLWSVRAALHLFAVGAVVGLLFAGQVRGQTVRVASVAGGSSALLGNFTADQNFRQGPVPQVIQDSPFRIRGYRPAGVPDSGVMVTSQVIVRDPNHTTGDPLETVSQALIRWYKDDVNNIINVIILLRSDSGNGVRYVGNLAKITDWQGAFKQQQPDGSWISPVGDGLVVELALTTIYVQSDTYDGSLLPIASGYSDVSADTVIRYANFPNLNVAGLQGIIQLTGPVQTLLLLHNKNMVYGPLGAEQLVFKRATVQRLLNVALGGTMTYWDDIDPLLQHTLVESARRENPSGTRNTEYTNIQRILPGDPLQFVPDDIPNVAMGTGPMLDFVDNIPASFGYAFVGGVAGDLRPNTRVLGYEDSDGNIGYPYPITTGAGSDCSLPHNNNQAPYSSDPYQTGVIDGSYRLWAYANVFSRPESQYMLAATAQQDIFAALNGAPDIVHQEGLLLASELSVERNYFISSFTGEKVTDGERVVPIGTALQVGEPPADDPNH